MRLSLKNQSTQKILLTALLVFTFAIRLPGLDAPLWLDEFISIRVATTPNFLEGLKTTVHPFLYFLLLRGWYYISANVVFLRLLSVSISTAAVFVVYKWLEKHSWQAGMLGGLMLATTQLFILKSREIRHYPLLMLVTALAFYAADNYIANPQKRGNKIFLLVISCLVVSTHYVGTFMIASIFIYILISKKPDIRSIFQTLLLFLPSLLVFILNIISTNSGDIVLQPFDDWIPVTTFAYWLSVIIVMLGVQNVLTWGMDLHLIAGILAGAVIVMTIANLARWGKWKPALPTLLTALIFWGASGIFSKFYNPIFYPRQMMVGLIPLYGAVAIQLHSIKTNSVRSITAGLIVGLSLFSVISFPYRQIYQDARDWSIDSDTLYETYQPTDIGIIIPPNASNQLNYYHPNLINEDWIGIDINAAQPLETLKNELDAKLQRQDATGIVLFVYMSYSMSISDDLPVLDGINALLDEYFCSGEVVSYDGIVLIQEFQPEGCTR